MRRGSAGRTGLQGFVFHVLCVPGTGGEKMNSHCQGWRRTPRRAAGPRGGSSPPSSPQTPTRFLAKQVITKHAFFPAFHQLDSACCSQTWVPVNLHASSQENTSANGTPAGFKETNSPRLQDPLYLPEKSLEGHPSAETGTQQK